MRLKTAGSCAVVVGLLCLGVRPADAQVPPLPAPQQDFSKVEIKTTKLAGDFYTLEGAGGTIGVLTGTDGVFMVDAQYAPLTDKIVAEISAP